MITHANLRGVEVPVLAHAHPAHPGAYVHFSEREELLRWLAGHRSCPECRRPSNYPITLAEHFCNPMTLCFIVGAISSRYFSITSLIQQFPTVDVWPFQVAILAHCVFLQVVNTKMQSVPPKERLVAMILPPVLGVSAMLDSPTLAFLSGTLISISTFLTARHIARRVFSSQGSLQ